MDVSALPKTEIHLHLDGSLSYEVASELRPGLTREEFENEFIAPPKCRDLADFLTRSEKAVELMQTKKALRLVTFDLFEQLKADNVIYAEIRFAPLLHIRQGLTPHEVVRTVETAARQASKETGISARLILCTLRHFTEEQSLQTVKLVEQFRDTTVAALDLAADEAAYSLKAHEAAFQYALAHNIPATAHAGEAKGAESVWESIGRLQVKRIGHGVRSIEDDKLVHELVRQGITLEVCPSCNIQTNIYPAFKDHPINRFYQQGVRVTVNTDNRTITHITLAEEYRKLMKFFGWTHEHFLRCNLHALEAAFIPDETRNTLKDKILAEYSRLGIKTEM